MTGFLTRTVPLVGANSLLWLNPEAADLEPVTDTVGNQNNTLCVEHNAQTKPHKHVPSKVLNELGIFSVDDLRSHTPVEQVARTAAGVADIVQQLDKVGRRGLSSL